MSATDPVGVVLGRFVDMAPAVARLTTYRPHCGRFHGRVFRSAGDALAYDAGYVASDDRVDCPQPAGTPYWQGWVDAAADWDRATEHGNDRANRLASGEGER